MFASLKCYKECLLYNIQQWTTDQMTNVEGVAHSDKLTDNDHPTLQLECFGVL